MTWRTRSPAASSGSPPSTPWSRATSLPPAPTTEASAGSRTATPSRSRPTASVGCASASRTISSAPGTARRASIARRRAWRARRPSSRGSTPKPPGNSVAGSVGLAHLVGSVPLESAESVFTTVLRALGHCLHRVPDGETGERRRWIYWQRTMLERHPAMEVDPEAGVARTQAMGRLAPPPRLATEAQARRRSRDCRLPNRLRRGHYELVDGLRAAPWTGTDPAWGPLSGLPAHPDVERVHVREPGLARRVPARLRARPSPCPRSHRGHHPRCRSLDPVGHLPGSAALRGLFPLPPRRLQGERLRPPGPAGRGGAARGGARLSPLLRQPGGSAPRHAEGHGHSRRDRGRSLRARPPTRRFPPSARAAGSRRSRLLRAAGQPRRAGVDSALSWSPPPRRRGGRPSTHRHRASSGRELRCRHRVRLGPRRSRADQRPSREPPAGRGVSHEQPSDPRRFLLISPDRAGTRRAPQRRSYAR